MFSGLKKVSLPIKYVKIFLKNIGILSIKYALPTLF